MRAAAVGVALKCSSAIGRTKTLQVLPCVVPQKPHAVRLHPPHSLGGALTEGRPNLALRVLPSSRDEVVKERESIAIGEPEEPKKNLSKLILKGAAILDALQRPVVGFVLPSVEED
jgi:hypothetical protein